MRERIPHPGSQHVCRCHEVLTRFSLIVADAAQFYEQISPEQVLKDVQALLERARRHREAGQWPCAGVSDWRGTLPREN